MTWAVEELVQSDAPHWKFWSAPGLTEQEARETADLWRTWGIRCYAVPLYTQPRYDEEPDTCERTSPLQPAKTS